MDYSIYDAKEAGFDKVGLKTEPQPYSGKKKK